MSTFDKSYEVLIKIWLK